MPDFRLATALVLSQAAAGVPQGAALVPRPDSGSGPGRAGRRSGPHRRRVEQGSLGVPRSLMGCSGRPGPHRHGSSCHGLLCRDNGGFSAPTGRDNGVRPKQALAYKLCIIHWACAEPTPINQPQLQCPYTRQQNALRHSQPTPPPPGTGCWPLRCGKPPYFWTDRPGQGSISGERCKPSSI